MEEAAGGRAIPEVRADMPTPQPPKKPAGKSAAAARKQPAKSGDGLMGWLGRQVGHVKKAVKTDVTKPRPKAKARPAASAAPSPPPPPRPGPEPAAAKE